MLNDEEKLKGQFTKILWVSPTSKLDEKVQSLKDIKNLLTPNKKLYKRIKKEIKKQQKEEKKIMKVPGEMVKMTEEDEMEFKKKEMDDEDFLEYLTLDRLQEIIERQKKVIQAFGKDFADHFLIVMDDSIQSKILKSKEFIDFLFKSRHYNISIIFISQSYFALPKPLRLNNSQILLFDSGSKKEIDAIYQENNNGISFQDFYEIFKETMKEPYSFLNINCENKRDCRLFKKFDEKIEY